MLPEDDADERVKRSDVKLITVEERSQKQTYPVRVELSHLVLCWIVPGAPVVRVRTLLLSRTLDPFFRAAAVHLASGAALCGTRPQIVIV